MVFSIRTMQKVIISLLCLWLLLLMQFSQHNQTPIIPHHQQRHERRQERKLLMQKRQSDLHTNGETFRIQRNHGDEASVDQYAHNVTVVLPTTGDLPTKKQRGRRKNVSFHPWQQEDRDRRTGGELTFNSTRFDKLLLPTPIIVMGFPKAGTSSIFAFFQRQGFKSQHWYCCDAQLSPQTGGPQLMAGCLMRNLKNSNERGVSLFDGCGDFDVYSEINGPRKQRYHPYTGQVGFLEDDGTIDYNGPGHRIFLPQHFRIQEIHEAYPNSTWILNLRETDPWVESVMSWGDDLHNQFFNEYFMQKAILNIPKEKNVADIKLLLKKIYIEHSDMVREFVKLHPSHALVEVNITSPDAGSVLGEAFGLDPMAWNVVNKNRKALLGTWRGRRVYGRIAVLENFTLQILTVFTTIYLAWTLGVEWAR